MSATKTPTSQARWLFGIAILVIAVAAVFGGRIVPIYDGVGFPDEPYRYINPPAGTQKTAAPTTAEDILTMSAGTNTGYTDMLSYEQGPQVQLYWAPKSIHADNSVTGLDIQAKPEAPAPTDEPADGTIAGNIYAVVSDQPATFNDKSRTSSLTLRIPIADQSKGTPVIEFQPTEATTWRQLDTMRYGNDIYEASTVGFGNYAMVVLKPTAHVNSTTISGQKTTKKQSGHTLSLPIIALMVSILPIALAILGIRLSGRKNGQTKSGSKRS
jgi:hypothetical protein